MTNSVLTLRLAGPMQSWGGRFTGTLRSTDSEPTKSGVIGMVAAALGVGREDSLEAFNDVRFGVRVDKPGRRVVDFQTAIQKGDKLPLTYREYLADASFLACLEGESTFMERCAEAINRPHYMLCLGRRSCPPAGRVLLGVRDKPLSEVLATEPWVGSSGVPPQKLRVVRDVLPGERVPAWSCRRDVPVSFSSKGRVQKSRYVVETYTDLITDEVDYFDYKE